LGAVQRGEKRSRSEKAREVGVHSRTKRRAKRYGRPKRVRDKSPVRTQPKAHDEWGDNRQRANRQGQKVILPQVGDDTQKREDGGSF